MEHREVNCMNLKTEKPVTAFNAVASHQPQAAAVTAFDELPDSAMLRLSSIATDRGKVGLLPISPASVWRKVKNGTFPAPIKFGPKTTAWKVADLRSWLAQQEAANQQPQAQAQ